MSSDPLNQARKEQTRLDFERLQGDILAWLKRRDGDDPSGFHKTRRTAMRSMLEGALAAFEEHLNTLDVERPRGQVYDRCRDLDEAVVWLQRLWEFIRARFDQRDDERLGRLLHAADEIVWSCYHQPVLQARQRDPSLPQPPPPLAFIEAEYSPAAVQSDRPLPPNFKLSPSSGVEFLDEYLRVLPLSLVRLPPWCVDAPWWLVYLGHEVGHHVLHDLRLASSFRRGVEAVAGKHGLPAGERSDWGRWSEEIFADVFSVVVMGSWAVWALAEAEWSPPEEMIAYPKIVPYPPAVLRLTIAERTANRLGMDGTTALHGLDLLTLAAGVPRLERDLKLVDDLVTFALGDLGNNLGTLPSLCGLDSLQGTDKDRELVDGMEKQVRRWSLALRRLADIPISPAPHTARHLASSAVCAWASIAAMDAPAREDGRKTLAEQMKKLLIDNAPKGTRSMGEEQDLESQGRALVQRMLGGG